MQEYNFCSGSYYESEGRIQYNVDTSQQDLGSSEQFHLESIVRSKYSNERKKIKLNCKNPNAKTPEWVQLRIQTEH
jgi:hypothetical protein